MCEFGHFVTHFSLYCPQYARKKSHHTLKQLLLATTFFRDLLKINWFYGVAFNIENSKMHNWAMQVQP